MNSRKPTQGALKGLKIIDLTRLLPGPLGTMLMADMGAEVLKIEIPQQPDYVRHFPPFYEKDEQQFAANYLAFNRSKKNVALDYTTPEGKELLLKLVEEADIFIEQFRPNYLKKFGLDYDSLKKLNEKLVYVSLTGYGQTGTYSQLAGHDLNFVSYSGALGIASDAQGKPVMNGLQIGDIAGGSYMAVIACLAGVFARQQTGKGQWIDVAMLDGMLPMMSIALTQIWAGKQGVEMGKYPLSGGLVNYHIYTCKDNKHIAVGLLEPKFWIKFCELVARPDLLGCAMPSEELFEENYKKIQDFFSAKTQNEWVQFAFKNDLPISPVYLPHEVAQDVHLQEREMIIQEKHPILGEIKGIGVPIKFSETPSKPAWIAPTLGEDTYQTLQEIGLDDTQIEALLAKGIIKK